MKTLRAQGFTLIELILVLALIGVVASFGAVMSLSSFSRSTVIQERDLFVSLLLRGARAKAMANIDETDHGIYIDNDCDRYILFADSDTFTPPTTCTKDPREIKYTSEAITVNNDSADDLIVFEQLSGNVPVGAGTITVQNGTHEQEIIISDIGQIDW